MAIPKAGESKKKAEDPTAIKGNVKILYLIVACCWLAGIAVSLVLGISLEPMMSVHPVIDSLFLTLTVFVFSMLFFGYVAPIIMFAVGMMQGATFAQNQLNFLLAAPVLLASYVGVLAGIYLRRDMQGKDNFFDHKKPIMIYVVVASVLSVAIPVLLMFLAS